MIRFQYAVAANASRLKLGKWQNELPFAATVVDKARLLGICSVLGVWCWEFPLRAQDGYCMVNGTTTGGAGGPTVTVTNGTDFVSQAGLTGPRTIQVSGGLSIGDVTVRSDKTILGLGTNAALLGRLSISGVSNVIVQNLRITNPGNDGISIRDPNTHHVWVDHCTFMDCGDGSCDISQGADYVTVSWCKFTYPTQQAHQFAMIADGPKDLGPLTAHITLHHNWWSRGANQRMAATSDALVHYYNNFFNCTNNSYCSNARDEAELNLENNFYAGVKDAVTVSAGTNGKIKTSGNSYVACAGTIHPGTDVVFAPPYAYSLDATANVPNLVTSGAGASGPDLAAFPPKIWDGGGTSDNLNTANNWGFAGGYNETPKEYDIMVFAGSTRPTPNNNFTANSEFAALNFSSNAGAFVLGGNVMNLGRGLTNDSATVQTLNLNLSFDYALQHYSSNRFVAVNATMGSLVINGGIAGPPPTFTTNVVGLTTNIVTNHVSFALTKLGPGRLTLNGLNSFYGPVMLNGGTVRFGSLAPAVAGGIGIGTNLFFNGGALQWSAGNTADISTRLVTINANGATLDVGANSVTLASPVGNNGAGGLTKVGPGTLTFDATNNYKGNTLIAQGTLALGAAGVLTNSPLLVLSNHAVLDVAGRSDRTLTLASNQWLLGDGTVRGSVIVGGGATVAPGFAIGTLLITNTLTFQAHSTNVMAIDAAAHTNALITGLSSVSYGGRLVVTNLAGTLASGAAFRLFEAASYSNAFASVTLPDLSGNFYWTNRLAVDGTIAVVAAVNPTPANLTWSASSSVLAVSWPTDRIGWRLEAQTNRSGLGLGSDWFTVPGSASTNQIALPIDPANGSVWLRLSYP